MNDLSPPGSPLPHDHARDLAYGFPTVFGRGLLDEFRNFVHPPFLVVTMDDLWPLFAHHFAHADCKSYLCRSIEQADLDREAAGLAEVRAIVGLGGGQALDVAKYFSWRLNLPLFQAPTALSVNAVYGQRSGVRLGGRVVYRGWAVPQAIYIDYDVLARCPPALNWSGIGDILCFHSGVLDWRYAEREGKIEEKWRFDENLARQSMAKVRAVIENVDNIRAMNDRGIEVIVDGLKWGTSYHGAGWCPRHIEGTDHFLFYTLEHMTGRKFLHGQPVCLGVVVGSMLHGCGAEEMLETISGIGLDIRPEAMGLTWDQLEEGLMAMRRHVSEVGLWHSIAHDEVITAGFVADLKERLTCAYAHRSP